MDTSRCSICGTKLPKGKSCRDLYHELLLYTLSHSDQQYFIHQHVVDSYAAQHITSETKAIGFAAPLLGLYLFSEKGYTGKEVQKAHMQLGNKMKEWPKLEIPKNKAELTIVEVLKGQLGNDRDGIIKAWARSVWKMWEPQHGKIRQLTDMQLQQ